MGQQFNELAHSKLSSKQLTAFQRVTTIYEDFLQGFWEHYQVLSGLESGLWNQTVLI